MRKQNADINIVFANIHSIKTNNMEVHKISCFDFKTYSHSLLQENIYTLAIYFYHNFHHHI
jgi:hypothetical protein